MVVIFLFFNILTRIIAVPSPDAGPHMLIQVQQQVGGCDGCGPGDFLKENGEPKENDDLKENEPTTADATTSTPASLTTTEPTTADATTSTPASLTTTESFSCTGSSFQMGSKCYKFYKDIRVSWDNATAWCVAEGLVMATKPDDILALRRYLLETYGGSYVHLGAMGNGSVLSWVDTDEAISNTDDLWMTFYPGSHVTTLDCMSMASNSYWMDNAPTQLLQSNSCTAKRSTLCQYHFE